MGGRLRKLRASLLQGVGHVEGDGVEEPVARHAVDYWRAQQKAGHAVDARIINTTSGAGLQGSIAQAAYSTAKGGIAALTLVQAAELGRYGITANALAPAARTRMTEQAFADKMAAVESGFVRLDESPAGPVVRSFGRYRDELVRCEDGRWRFELREAFIENTVPR